MPSEKERKLIIAQQTKEAFQEIYDFGDLRVGFFHAIDPTKDSSPNQDVIFARQQGSKVRLGVADGAGGHPLGDQAALCAAEQILEPMDRSISEAFSAANQAVLDLKAGARSTLSVAEIDDSQVSFHSTGDSEILHWNQSGRLLFRSLSYSPTGFKLEAGLISPDGALKDPERHLVLSLIGDELVRWTSTNTVDLRKGHSLLIGSDGLFDNLSHSDLGGLLTGGSFEGAFQALVDLCLQRNPDYWLKQDDLSWIFARKM